MHVPPLVSNPSPPSLFPPSVALPGGRRRICFHQTLISDASCCGRTPLSSPESNFSPSWWSSRMSGASCCSGPIRSRPRCVYAVTAARKNGRAPFRLGSLAHHIIKRPSLANGRRRLGSRKRARSPRIRASSHVKWRTCCWLLLDDAPEYFSPLLRVDVPNGCLWSEGESPPPLPG